MTTCSSFYVFLKYATLPNDACLLVDHLFPASYVKENSVHSWLLIEAFSWLVIHISPKSYVIMMMCCLLFSAKKAYNNLHLLFVATVGIIPGIITCMFWELLHMYICTCKVSGHWGVKHCYIRRLFRGVDVDKYEVLSLKITY